ncbi:phosphoglycerate mutase-like protein, partial [Cystobasidium minutum MCA 4210]|uniref:phosphoglycerate mutase-like protein n=1 Tax=Cystobasidium minutum MCA 4210 TaxID=1397322 RepID=UPI0034CDB369
IRHGETADNARHIIQGHIDTPLNETGIKQSQATKDLLRDVKIDVCFTSDLQRAKKTAEIILEDYHPDTPLIVDKRIKEKYLGLMEGQKYYSNRSPEVLASIEPLETFTNRLLHFWDD